MAAVTVCSYLGAQENKICHCFHCFPSICLEVMGLDARTYNNAFLRKSYKWSHKVCGVLCLASFPWCNALNFIHAVASSVVFLPVTLKKLKLNGSMKTYKTF